MAFACASRAFGWHSAAPERAFGWDSVDGGTTVIQTAAASEARGGIGLFYPDLGIVILRPSALKTKAGISFSTGSNTMGNNSGVVFDSLTSGAYFQARREENISSTHYFVRAGNKQFNFSTNPTFFTSSNGLDSINLVRVTVYDLPGSHLVWIGWSLMMLGMLGVTFSGISKNKQLVSRIVKLSEQE